MRPTGSSSSPPRLLWLLAGGVCLLLVAGSTTAGDSPHPRSRLFAAVEEDPVTSRLAGSRWSALLFLQPWDCTPEELRAARALNRAAADFSDLQVLTVVPRSSLSRLDLFAGQLPGEIVGVDDSLYRRQAEIVPIPRIEVWDAEGHLLLMRSLPRVIAEETLYAEIIWSRSFTRPLVATAR